MVIYGFLTGESIGKLLIAGLIPGLVMAGVLLVGIAGIVWMKPHLAPKITERFSLGERLSSLKNLWLMIILVILVLGGMYMGFFAPSAAGAVGVTGTILLSAVKRQFSFKMMRGTVRETLMMTSVISIVILGGLLFGRFLTVSGFLDATLDIIKTFGFTKSVFLGSIAVLYLILGCFVDTLSIWLITVPVLHPIALSMGLDPLWFAVFILQLSSIGCLTPPVGLNLFAVMAASEGRIRIGELYVGVLPFVALEFVVLALLFVFPEMVTWLPSRMIR
jgi:tripartite ATP-independent transporter DctM subunit